MNGNRTADAVVAIELFRNRQVSNVATGRFLVLNNQPPLLNQPRNNAQIPPIQPQNLLFSWTPRHTTAPTGLVYELFLYEVPEGEDPAVVVNSGLPAVQRLLSSQPSFLYGPAQLPLSVGQRYAWQVRVESLDQQVAFSNGGLSDVGSFVYGAPPCPPPAQLEAVVSAELGEVQLRWQPPLTTDPPVQSYLLSYAAHPNGLPTQRSLTATEYLLLQLPAEQPYQWRVQSVCAQGLSVAVVSSFELPAAVQAEPSWISDPQIAYEPPQDPLPNPEVMQSSENEQEADAFTPEEQAAAEATEAAAEATDATASIDDILNTPVKIFVAAEGGGDLPAGLPAGLPVLDNSASTDQLRDALNIKPPDCAGISSQYQCGNHDNVPTYSGEIIPAKAGDELAMNSMIISVVDIDGSGNGQGLIKMPMMNNIKLGLKLSDIKVAKGGCIVAGSAELSGVSASILNEQQRANLQKAYAAYNQVLDVAAENAGAIAETYNTIADLLKALRQKAKAVVDKINSGQKPTKTELKTLQQMAKTATEAKKKELALWKEKPGADTSPYVSTLSTWLEQQQQGIGCVNDLVAQAPAPKKGGPNQEWSFFVADCVPIQLIVPEPVAPQPVVIAPLIAYALKKMAEAGTGALLDGVVQYSVYKYATGLGWEEAWDKIEFDKSSMFFSGISSMVKNKALSVGIDAVGSVVSYVVETPAEAITMSQVLVELGKGAGMGLVANFGGDAVRAVSNKLGADKVTEGFVRLCKDLKIGKETGEKVASLLDGIVDKNKFDNAWEKIFGKVLVLRPLLKAAGELKIGKYGDLRKVYTIGKNSLTAHHIPSDAYMEKLVENGILSRSLYKKGGDDGLCIVVESAAGMTNRTARHNRTKTFLSNLGSSRPAYYNFTPKQALEFDIEDLRNIYKDDGIYDESVESALQDLIKQTKAKYKSIFD